jgi:hypothetical protein
MAVWVRGMRASRYPTCFAIDVSSRDDSQVVLESVGRPRNTVLAAWQRYGLHQASSCLVTKDPSRQEQSSTKHGGGWRQRILAEPGS